MPENPRIVEARLAEMTHHLHVAEIEYRDAYPEAAEALRVAGHAIHVARAELRRVAFPRLRELEDEK